jgi:hypothetical protein
MRERVITKSGRALSDADIDRLADRLDEGIDLSTWQPRRGRPSLGANAREHSPRIAVRIPDELNDRVRTRAAREGRSVSDVVRTLLEGYAPAARAATGTDGPRGRLPRR